MTSRLRDLQGLAILFVAVIGIGLLVLRNVQPGASYTIPIPTRTITPDSSWSQVIQDQLVNGATSLPTNALPVISAVPPTLPPISGTTVLLAPTQVFQAVTPTPTRFAPSTATQPGPTSVASPTGPTVLDKNNPNQGQFSPPPEIAPLSLDPRDHFWFQRPVDSSANSQQLYFYVYGSNGPTNDWRIHHGIDLPNPIGKEVHAAADGIVVWASDKYTWREDGVVTDIAYSYGNVVIVRHDFGYEGQQMFTLYAHLSAFVVAVGDRVKAGDVVGLSGESGEVSGPHVHFEVRIARNNYFATRNPILWMVPLENHGVVAGRVLYRDGTPVEDAKVTLIQNGRIIDTTTTYIQMCRPGLTVCHVNQDDVWAENFALGDVPAGDYIAYVEVNGVRLTKEVIVHPATTSFVDLGFAPLKTTPGTVPTYAP